MGRGGGCWQWREKVVFVVNKVDMLGSAEEVEEVKRWGEYRLLAIVISQAASHLSSVRCTRHLLHPSPSPPPLKVCFQQCAATAQARCPQCHHGQQPGCTQGQD